MIIQADARHLPLTDGCVQCVVTSPPYFGLRDYGHGGQIGMEQRPDEYIANVVDVFRELRRVLASDGTAWLNLGDSYAASGKGGNPENSPFQMQASNVGSLIKGHRAVYDGYKVKDLMMIPARVALALQADGWYLRSDIIWSKPNPMPESVTDRPTKAHEYLFLLTKSERYYYDAAAIYEPYAEQTLADREADGGFYDGDGTKDYAAAGVQNPSDTKRRIIASMKRKNERSGNRQREGFNDRWDEGERASSARANQNRVCGFRETPGKTTDSGHDKVRADFYQAGGRNRRTVWTIPTMPYAGAHFATMPEKLVEPCILAGSRPGDLILDPFLGSGTVGAVADRLMRRWVGTDLSYQALAKKRTAQAGLRLVNE